MTKEFSQQEIIEDIDYSIKHAAFEMTNEPSVARVHSQIAIAKGLKAIFCVLESMYNQQTKEK